MQQLDCVYCVQCGWYNYQPAINCCFICFMCYRIFQEKWSGGLVPPTAIKIAIWCVEVVVFVYGICMGINLYTQGLSCVIHAAGVNFSVANIIF